jgi:lipopolysaccharide/colanic/teichoic acid biosynthesis glycosyltransferase
VTWIGRFIRRFSLDEFPQLWCVLTGEMSLVGPRPALPREVDNYTQSDRRRLGVRPGLTCIWQVSGRADVPFEGQVQMDIEYVESHNFWLDLKLVASTVPAVLSGRGAY